MTDLSKHKAFIAGVAETPLGEVYDHTEQSMIALAAREALAEAGLTLADVDGLACAHIGMMRVLEMAEYLGVQPRWMDGTELGGTSFLSHVTHAIAAIEAGMASVVLVAYASRQRTKGVWISDAGMEANSTWGQFSTPARLPAPIGQFALAAARHMYQYGTTEAQFAEVAMTARAWAKLNPKAWAQSDMTLADYHASPMISTPIRQADCCLRTDGGGVLIVTGEAHAKNAAKRPVRVIGAGEAASHFNISEMPDLTVTPGADSGRRAFEMAGITPADVDVFQPYDAFTITPLLALEDLGFCDRGAAGEFVAAGHMRPGGKLPSMTSGGGLSYCHPGQFGILLTIEAVRQLRGECGARQVPDASIAVGHGFGGFLSANSTLVLARD